MWDIDMARREIHTIFTTVKKAKCEQLVFNRCGLSREKHLSMLTKELQDNNIKVTRVVCFNFDQYNTLPLDTVR